MKRYEDTLARNEIRWVDPPDRDLIDRTVDTLQGAGVDGWVCSGVSQECVPLFPSTVYPTSHPKANREWLPYLLGRAEAAGITVISWYALNHSRSVAERYPEYRMQLLEGSFTPEADPEHPYLCVNSPYLDLLVEFGRELIRSGFRGIWFDGNTVARHGTRPVFQPGCRCRYCEDRFRRDSGLGIPRRIDFDDPVFRQWAEWRYAILVRAWSRIADAVHDEDPDATVCLNNYRRRGQTWSTGIPMRSLGLDVVLSGELDGFMAQADFQMKMHHAMACRRGAETWIPMTHYWDMWKGNPEPVTMAQGALGAVCAGGNVFCGTDNLATVRGSMPEVVSRVKAIHPHRGGRMLRYAAIWVSQQTQDWEGCLDPAPTWNSWHGANELLNHAHLQGGVVLDDAVERGDLAGFSVIIGAENTCVSDRQLAALMDFAERGGLLVACGRFAAKDGRGASRPVNPLHEFLGVRAVGHQGEFVYGRIDPAYRAGDYPESVFAGSAFQRIERTVERTGVVTVAMAQVRRGEDDSPGILIRPHGRGAVAYFNSDVFAAYATTPIRFQMELVAAVLCRHAPPRVRVRAPMAVTVNVFEKADEYVVFLHNNPGAVYRYPHGCYAQGEVAPALDVEVDASALGVSRAVRAGTGAGVAIADGRFRLDRIDYGEAVILRKGAR